MTIPRSRVASRVLLAAALAMMAVAGIACAYSWTVGSQPTQVDGGAGQDAGALDATVADASHPDASSPSDAGSDVVEPPFDATPSCAELYANLDKERTAAKVCTPFSTQCANDVIDECGCKSYVADAGSAAANAFAAAVAVFEDAGCPPFCDAGVCLTVAGSCLPATSRCAP